MLFNANERRFFHVLEGINTESFTADIAANWVYQKMKTYLIEDEGNLDWTRLNSIASEHMCLHESRVEDTQIQARTQPRFLFAL